MSDIDLQQVLSNRYRTSQEADKYTAELQRHLGLSTKAQVARIALGRSLSLGKIEEASVDSKGLDIPATSLFTRDDIGSWVGLLVTHANANGDPAIDSMDALRASIRGHWHRGAVALWRDWIECEENYNKFIEALVLRRSEMPEIGNKRAAEESGAGAGDVAADMSQLLVRALNELGIRVQVKDVLHGPRLSRYRVILVNLADSAKLRRSMPQLGLALSLGNTLPTVSNGDEPKTVFIDLPRPKAAWTMVGIERLKAWAASAPRDAGQLLVYAGVDVVGADVAFDLATMPHLLVGGTTGSGKSVFLHSLIMSLVLRHTPETLQLALIDPKQVEFSPYRKLPNLYRGEIVFEVDEAREYLEELVVEMESRYSVFNRLGVANIGEARRAGHSLPFIVLVIEELADLVLRDDVVEQLVERLAQKARAAGIHLVLATQRPDSETFSGLIRSNIPGRIALAVQKGTESTIILDEKGAENLLGVGDMLIRRPGEQALRAHGVHVRMEDVLQIVGRRG